LKQLFPYFQDAQLFCGGLILTKTEIAQANHHKYYIPIYVPLSHFLSAAARNEAVEQG